MTQLADANDAHAMCLRWLQHAEQAGRTALGTEERLGWTDAEQRLRRELREQKDRAADQCRRAADRCAAEEAEGRVALMLECWQAATAPPPPP